MRVEREIVSAEELRRLRVGLVIEQDGAENGPLSFYAGGQSAIECVIRGGHLHQTEPEHCSLTAGINACSTPPGHNCAPGRNCTPSGRAYHRRRSGETRTISDAQKSALLCRAFKAVGCYLRSRIAIRR